MEYNKYRSMNLLEGNINMIYCLWVILAFCSMTSSFSPEKGSELFSSSNDSNHHPNSVLQKTQEPPEFLLHPENSFIIRNKNAKLTCTVIRSIKAYFVCNGEAMAVTDYHKETDRLNEENENEKTLALEVNRIQVEEFFGAYVCYCDAWYERGKVSSRNITVELAYFQEKELKKDYPDNLENLRKEFEVPPYSQNVELGSQIQLNCHPPKGVPKPRIYWLKDRVEVQPERDPNYIQAADGHLIIIQAREKDRANYTCVAENVANRRLSPPARLGIHVSGGWSDWSEWSSCSGKCGSGYVTRTRKCDNPLPRWGGPECEGLYIQKNKCANLCPALEASWSPWSSWSGCTSDCVRHRRRECSGSLKESCRGKDRIVSACNESKCRDKRQFFGPSSSNNSAQEIVETDLSLLVGLSVAIFVFIAITLASVKFLRRKGSVNGNAAMFTMTNLNYGGRGVGKKIKKEGGESGYLEEDVLGFKTEKKFSDLRCSSTRGSSRAYSITDDETTHLTKLCYDSVQSTPYTDKKVVLQSKLLGGKSLTADNTPRESPVMTTRVNPRFIQERLTEEHQYDIPFGHINNKPPPDVPPPPAPDNRWDQDPSLLQPRLIRTYGVATSSSSSSFSEGHNESIPESSPFNYRESIGSCTIDPDYFTFSSVTNNGSIVSLENMGVTLTIPEGALDKNYTEEIFLALMTEARDKPRLSKIQTLLSPVILMGPPRLSFKKPVVLSFRHCAKRKDSTSWELGVYHCDSLFSDEPALGSDHPWVKLATLGKESTSSPIITVVESETIHIMTDFLTRFCIVGQSSLRALRPAMKYFEVFVLIKPVTSSLDYSMVIIVADKTQASVSRYLQWARKRNYGFLSSGTYSLADGGYDLRLLIAELSVGWSFKPQTQQTVAFDALWSSEREEEKTIVHYSISRVDLGIKSLSFKFTICQNDEENCLSLPILFDVDSRLPLPSLEDLSSAIIKNPFRLPSGLKRRLASALDASDAWKALSLDLKLNRFDRFFQSRSPSPADTVLTLWEALEDDAGSEEGKVGKLMNFLRNSGRDDLAIILEKEYGPWV